MSQQKIDLELRGLYTAPNNLSGVPQGALEIADNVVINSRSLISSRRGQTQYGTPLVIGSDQINKYFNYSTSLIVNYADKMAYDSGSGTWVDYSGTYLTPASGYKMRSLEALKNFYFTTSKGIYKISGLTGNPQLAGVGTALGGTGITSGTPGFLLDDSAVAYRLVWGYIDANKNLILGPPSQRIIVRNATGSSADVSLNFIIPAFVTTDYFYQIYRSFGTATATDEPADELQLVIQGTPTSGEIVAKNFTVLDETPYSLMRASLYTNPSQEGIANSNNPPPYALDMDVFKTCAFYANIRQRQTLTIAMISVDSPSIGYVTQTGTTATGTSTITSIADTSDIRQGMRVVGTGVGVGAVVTSVGASSVVVSVVSTAPGTVSLEFQDRFSIAGVQYWAGSTQNTATNTFLIAAPVSPGTDIESAATNLVALINTSPSNTTIYAYYTSGTDDLPGQMFFEERVIGGAAFSATSTAGSSFSPTLPTTGTTVLSDNEERQNRVIISKPGQVEAVPIYRFFDIGSANFPITKVVALRDGIFFFKQDGIYRISGETFENFSVTLLDNTVVLQVPESAVPFNNQVFCFTTQGVCAITDSGVKIMSVPIETELLQLSSDQFVNFADASFGVAYESARLYMFYTVTQEDDEFATQAFVYNSLTDSWTRWPMDRTCGIVNTAVNKLFMGQPDTGQTLIERKNYTDRDYADEQYAATITVVISDTEYTLASTTNVVAGMTLVQNSRRVIIESVDGNNIVTTGSNKIVTGAAIVYQPIMSKIQWSPIDADNPGILKQFSEMSFIFRDAVFDEIDAGFSSNIALETTVVPIANRNNGGAWGAFPWGSQAWGGSPGGETILRTYVPREKQRAAWLGVSLETNQAFTGFSLQGVSIIFNPMSSRIR